MSSYESITRKLPSGSVHTSGGENVDTGWLPILPVLEKKYSKINRLLHELDEYLLSQMRICVFLFDLS